jgi:hypothetical protein
MKKSAWLTPLFILLFIAFAIAFPDVANAVAKFDYSDLTIEEEFVYANEQGNGETTVTVTVTNTGDEPGAHVVQLKINGVLENNPVTIDTLAAGGQKKVLFTLSKPAGEYIVSVGNLEKTFTVLPSNFKIENLIIDPEEAKEGESVAISITALNTSADKELTFDALKLIINGDVVASKSVKLKAADSTKVSFTVSRDVPGDYVVQIGPKTGSFTVTASFWSSFPPYMWAIFGAVAGVLVMLIIVLFLTAPRRRGKSATPRIKKGAKEPSIPVSQPAAKTPFLSPSEPAKPPMMPVPAPGPARSPVPSPAPYPAQSAQPKPAQSYPAQPMQVPPGTPRPPAPSSQTLHTPPPPHPVTPSLPRVIPQPQPNMRPNVAPLPRAIPPQPTPVPPPVHIPKVEPPSMPHVTPTPFAMPAKTTPLFSVGNLTITPNQIKEGDPVTITAVVSNSGTATGQYSMVLRIGSVVENIAELTLNPGERQTATFSVVKDIAGDYHVEVDGLRGIFTVIPRLPASFTISNLTITPERVKQGETVNISAIVANTGETEGSYSVVLRIKGIAERIEEITLSPGKNQRVVFNITKDAAGFYPIALENLSGRFVVEMDWT